MLSLIVEKSEILFAQRMLEKQLFAQLPQRNESFTIGYQGGSLAVNNLHADRKIWFMPKKIESRHWNAFGLAKKLNSSTSNSITVEINIPLSGENGRIAGLFARDEKNSLYLLHRGKVGGGKRGVGKDAFLEWSQLTLTSVQLPSGKLIDAVLVGKIESPSLSSDVARFVYAVANFKAAISNQEITDPPSTELEASENSENSPPRSAVVQTTVFNRDPAVTEHVKRRANGHCDLCGEKAPFLDSQGKPYLECHHISWLAHGGADSIENACALCPNCHRKMHIVDDPEDVKHLASVALKRN